MAQSLRAKIQDEIKTIGNHEWAGQYYHGDGLGVNVSLILAPKAGYLFEWHGCLGLYDRNYGAVAWDKGKLRLTFTFENKREGFQGIAEEFVPVSWGDRKYLIPSNEIVGFCNEVNGGSESRRDVHGRYLLRWGDEKKEVKGFPVVPEKFKPYLLARPIEAEIIGVGRTTTRPSVGGWTFKETPVTLNCGKKKNLLAGMELQVVEPPSDYGSRIGRNGCAVPGLSHRAKTTALHGVEREARQLQALRLAPTTGREERESLSRTFLQRTDGAWPS
jgi:hypothetical protein